MASCRLVLCDLDGTLLRHGHPISRETAMTMAQLEQNGCVVALASGRSLYSGRGILPVDLPFSYWIFSTGVGILDWREDRIICRSELAAKETSHAAEVLYGLGENVMVQEPVPENHRFVYWAAEAEEGCMTDFFRRCRAYDGFCRPFEPAGCSLGPSSQLICILPEDLERIGRLVNALPGYKVIRATSPMDGKSVWLEIFNPDAGKAQGAQRLAEFLQRERGLEVTDIYAIGNDYNDLDMLKLADHAFVTPNAPPDMKRAFSVTMADTEGALAEAAKAWGLI